MRPWKSSDGGTIRQLGASSATISASATIVSAAANVKGIILRTAAFRSTSAATYMDLKAGGTTILAHAGAASTNMAGEIFLPAGTSLAMNLAAGTGFLSVTYDIL